MVHNKRSLASCFLATTNELPEHWEEKVGITYSA